MNEIHILGIRVRVPEVEQKVLTTAEARCHFLRTPKDTIYDVWAMALMTGMRSECLP